MKALLLASGGIDSPVAAFLMLRQGVQVSAVHFDNGSQNYDKVRKLLSLLAKKFGTKIELHYVDINKIQETISLNTNRRFQCVLCKRFMYRIAEKLAKKKKIDVLLTGDNLGQVASQTLENMTVCTSAVDITILRPLLCFDKQETINIAREIGTFDISIIRTPGCPWVPRNPATMARIEKVKEQEKRLPVDELVDDALDNMKSEVIG